LTSPKAADSVLRGVCLHGHGRRFLFEKLLFIRRILIVFLRPGFRFPPTLRWPA
jgi:hypothetical protein